MLPAVVHHDHGSVVQIGHALAGFLSVLDDMHHHLFAGQNHRFYGIRQFVDIHDGNALQLRHFVEVIIIGENFPLDQLPQPHQLGVNFRHILEIAIVNLNKNTHLFLNAVQNIQAAPSTVSLEQVRRIRDVLQFLQHETGNQQRPFDKTAFADIGDPSVNNDAGI